MASYSNSWGLLIQYTYLSIQHTDWWADWFNTSTFLMVSDSNSQSSLVQYKYFSYGIRIKFTRLIDSIQVPFLCHQNQIHRIHWFNTSTFLMPSDSNSHDSLVHYKHLSYAIRFKFTGFIGSLQVPFLWHQIQFNKVEWFNTSTFLMASDSN